jgi:hypothetical protein
VPVTVQVNGQNVTFTSTFVNDNKSTNVVLSFTDEVLQGGDEIDVSGNNLFECAELGSCLMFIQYANRLFAIGEQNKITNLLNWSFDGGVVVTQGNAGGGGGTGTTQTTYPAGWNIDPNFGAGGSVVASPIFGSAYQILNTSGSTQAKYGMITQGAFQDEFEVAIIDPSTTYSVRATLSCPTGAASGQFVVDLFSPALGQSVGQFLLNLTGVATSMQIFSGTLLTTTLAPVPNDLQLRLYAAALPNGVQINVDRIEVFPTEQPTLSNEITGSYQGNFESFDQISGVVKCDVQNQQPVKSAFTLFDQLYIVKSNSFLSVKDNASTEPANWAPPRVISNSVGTTSIYGVTTGIDEPNSGEEWALIAGRAGLFIFNGGEPVKLSEEIQSLWNFINWTFGHLLWVKNDIINRRILIGVPMNTQKADPNTGAITQNPWIPAGIIADTTNATFNNVILELNYKQLNTASLVTDKIGVRTSYSAKLIASEIVRKWSIWTIQAPAAAFLSRSDKTAPLFLGNSADTGKVYELVDGLLNDDGLPFHQIYRTYGFPTGEQGQGMQMGVMRMNYDYMTMIIDGSGAVVITVFPNNVKPTNPFSHILLPNLTLPATSNSDVELPLNECGSRLFLMFDAFAVGAGYKLSRIVMVMHADPWAPVAGVNN